MFKVDEGDSSGFDFALRVVDTIQRHRHHIHTAFYALAGLAILGGIIHHKSNHNKQEVKEPVTAAFSESEFLELENARLKQENKELSNYANDARMLANSMKYYPTEPDCISDLPEEEQEKAAQKVLEDDEKAHKKHDDLLATLGVDTNLLFRVQQGPKIYE